MLTDPPVLLIGALGSAVAATTGGPLAEVFNETALVLAIMGGFGGMTRGLAVRLSRREVARGVFLGGLLAFGFGVLSPELLYRLFALEVAAGTPAIPVLAATAFIIGFAQELLITWMATKQKKEDPHA